MDRERRHTPRYQFILPAQLVDETSGARLDSWVADIGSRGCSLTLTRPPQQGTPVQLRIGFHPAESFRARAIVVHTCKDRAGLSFSEVKPQDQLLLQKWLASSKFSKGWG
jgi:PilZ domain